MSGYIHRDCSQREIAWRYTWSVWPIHSSVFRFPEERFDVVFEIVRFHGDNQNHKARGAEFELRIHKGSAFRLSDDDLPVLKKIAYFADDGVAALETFRHFPPGGQTDAGRQLPAENFIFQDLVDFLLFACLRNEFHSFFLVL